MKKTNWWIFFGILISFMVMSFITDLPTRVDTDVGICMTDIDETISTLENQSFKIQNNIVTDYFLNEAEVEISPGDNLSLERYDINSNKFQIYTPVIKDMKSYSFTNIGTLLTNENFLNNKTTINLIGKSHNISKEVSGIFQYYNTKSLAT